MTCLRQLTVPVYLFPHPRFVLFSSLFELLTYSQIFFLLCPLTCSWVFIHEKAYQTSDTGIESSVMTKVKGFGYHQGQVMDVADYVFPSQVRGLDNIWLNIYFV